jgi:hypothetical protein
MSKSIEEYARRLLIWAILSLAALVRIAAAQPPCFGDCNDDTRLTASDIGRINSTILRCGPCEGGIPGGVAAGCEGRPGGCPEADFNADGCLRASELGRANQNILRFSPDGCATPTEGTEAATATPTETATPSPTPAPATPTPDSTCGDGLLSGSETCESCPGDCTVAPCTVPSPAPTVTFRVNWSPPFGVDASSTTVLLAYRSALVSLPGSGAASGQTPPANRIVNRPSNAIVSVNDFDYAIRVVVTRSGSITPGRLFNVNYDRCTGAAAPAVSDFACTVQGCASSSGDIAGCTCVVVTP